MKYAVINPIFNAISILYKRDYYLIQNNVSERSISHKLGCYLQVLYNDYDVDCEYNRNALEENGHTKRIHLYGKSERDVMPDIIVHKRGNNDENLLIVECKKYIGRDLDYDRKKMEFYTTGKFGNLGYTNGAIIVFCNNRDNQIDGSVTVYEKGLPCEKYYYSWKDNNVIPVRVRLPKFSKIIDFVKFNYQIEINSDWILDIKKKYGLPIVYKKYRIKLIQGNYEKCPEEYVRPIVLAYKHFDVLKDIRI